MFTFSYNAYFENQSVLKSFNSIIECGKIKCKNVNRFGNNTHKIAVKYKSARG